MITTEKNKLNEFVKIINTKTKEDVQFHGARQQGFNLPSITGKIDGGIKGITAKMQKAFGPKVVVTPVTGDIAKKVSGKLDSFLVKFGVGKDEWGFYFRSIVSERGSLTDKDLTPAKLRLGGKTLNKRDIVTAVTGGLELSSLPGNIVELAQQLLRLSTGKGTTISIDRPIKDTLTKITASDLKKFGKNYGEVVLAHWCLYNKPHAESIFFPPAEANPLADFVVNFTKQSKKPPLNVSAKFEGGANASLNSFIKKDSKPPKTADKKEILAFNAIKAVAYGSNIIQGLIDAEVLLQTKEYKIIKKMVGEKPVTRDTIALVIETVFASLRITPEKITQDQYNAFLKEMEPFYTASGGGIPKLESLSKIAALPKKEYFHPVLYAFSVALAATFNSNADFSNVLDKAAASIKAEQIYLNISNINITIKVKVFSKSKFKFAPGAYAHAADNVRMKVAMVK